MAEEVPSVQRDSVGTSQSPVKKVRVGAVIAKSVAVAAILAAIRAEFDLYLQYRYEHLSATESFLAYRFEPWEAKVLVILVLLAAATLLPDHLWEAWRGTQQGKVAVAVVHWLRRSFAAILLPLPALVLGAYVSLISLPAKRGTEAVVFCPPDVAPSCPDSGCVSLPDGSELCRTNRSVLNRFVLGDNDAFGRATVVDISCVPGQGARVEERIRRIENKKLKISTQYPTFLASCESTGFVEIGRKLRTEVIWRIGEFRKAQDTIEKEFGIRPGDADQYLTVECNSTFISPTLASGYCTHSFFVAGAQAHSSTETTNWTFQVEGASARPVTLADVLVDGAFAWQRLQEVVREKLRAQHAPDGWDEWDAKSHFSDILTPAFALGPQALVFRFDEYTVDAFVSGRREMRVPFSDLDGVIKAHWLR